MSRTVALIFMVACGGSPPCPSTEAIGGSDAVARREAVIVVERCKADGWSKVVIDCLEKAAGNQGAQEACFRQLSKEQKDKLKAAFEPLHEELDAIDRTATLEKVDRDISALKLDQLTARAAGCADYVTAVAEIRTALGKCGQSLSLESFGSIDMIRRDTQAFGAISDAAAVAAECTARAKALRSTRPSCP